MVEVLALSLQQSGSISSGIPCQIGLFSSEIMLVKMGNQVYLFVIYTTSNSIWLRKCLLSTPHLCMINLKQSKMQKTILLQELLQA